MVNSRSVACLILCSVLLVAGCTKASKVGVAQPPVAPPATAPAAPPEKVPTNSPLPAVEPCTPVAVADELPVFTPSESASGTRFAIDAASSCVSYTVGEKLAEQPLPSNAVGVTSAMAGQFMLAPNGTIDAASAVVDMRTLKSDSERRDGRARNIITMNEKEPLAQFTSTGPQGTVPTGAAEIAFKLTGNLKIHGVEKAVVMDAKATVAGDVLTLTGVATIKMSDFGIEPINLLGFVKVEDTVQLYAKIIARNQRK